MKYFVFALVLLSPLVSRAQYTPRSSVVNVKDPRFAGGAKGDGVTDDTAAIQAAIDSLDTGSAYAGGTVYFPVGRYVNKGLQVGSSGTPGRDSFISLAGENRAGSELDYIGPSTGTAIFFSEDHDFRFENLTVNNRGPAKTATGVVTAGPATTFGTQTNGGFINQVVIIGFNIGWQTSTNPMDGGLSGSTSSELTFGAILFENCHIGFYTNDYNALNMVFLSLGTGFCDIGLQADTSGVYILGGNTTHNPIDFYFRGGPTFPPSSISNVRSENVGLFLGTSTPIDLCADTVTNIVPPGSGPDPNAAPDIYNNARVGEVYPGGFPSTVYPSPPAIIASGAGTLNIRSCRLAGPVWINDATFVDMTSTGVVDASPLVFNGGGIGGGRNIRYRIKQCFTFPTALSDNPVPYPDYDTVFAGTENPYASARPDSINPIGNQQAGTVVVDFNSRQDQLMNFDGFYGNSTLNFSTINLRAGAKVSITILGNSATNNFVFPAWRWLGNIPAGVAPNMAGVLTLRSTGTTDTAVLANYAGQQ